MSSQTFAMNDGFTLTISDPGNLFLGGATVDPLIKNVNFIIDQLNTYLVFNKALDLRIDIKPASESSGGASFAAEPQYATQNGHDVFVAQVKAATGVDLNGAAADSAVIMYVGQDGSIINYGSPLWFDPNPQSGVTPSVPNGEADFFVFVHELFHTFGFSSTPSDDAAWPQHIYEANGVYYYGSPTIRALLGGDLPVASDQTFYGVPGHYGDTSISYQPITSGLMYEWGNYANNRIDIGQADLLVLQDLGWQIKNYRSLPLVDPIDSAAVTGTAGNDVLQASKVSSIVAGGGGDDKIILPSGTGLGNYLIDGGSGANSVIVGQAYAGFDLVKYDSDYLLQNKAGLDGVSLLRSIQTVVFSDATVTIDGADADKTVTATAPGVVQRYGQVASAVHLGTDGGAVVVQSGGETDRLIGVDALQFADRTVIVAQMPTVTGTPTTGNITELYAAVLGREPDIAGLAYYQAELAADPALPMTVFAQWFLASPEYAGNAAHNYAQGAAGDAQFIADTYGNLLHRAPENGAVAYYQAVIGQFTQGLAPGSASYIDAETKGHALVLVDFSASPEFLSDVQITAQHPADAQHWLVLV